MSPTELMTSNDLNRHTNIQQMLLLLSSSLWQKAKDDNGNDEVVIETQRERKSEREGEKKNDWC